MIAAALLAAITLGAAGCSAGHGTPVAPAVSATTLRQPTTPAGSSSTAAAVLSPPHLSRSAPTRLQIPATGVDTTLMALGLRADGSMQVPPGGFPAGWYTGGPTPGELGPAVIAGHIDMKGPGVFYALHNVLRGDRVTVTRSDGSLAVFSVTAVGQYPKNRFPTTVVYGNIDHAGLRLITCGGSFNSASGHYEDDLVVFADFVAPPGSNGSGLTGRGPSCGGRLTRSRWRPRAATTRPSAPEVASTGAGCVPATGDLPGFVQAVGGHQGRLPSSQRCRRPTGHRRAQCSWRCARLRSALGSPTATCTRRRGR